ncbi:1,4-alpha-glucan branching protein GlgB [Orrella sp. JC864]|uniref:1,4-alpha-glucan branching protein GlgB n=1 Tax=Orrella sp. JC864 TaxID=3120298 RepID=UPI00300A8B8F
MSLPEQEIDALLRGEHSQPFAVLGRHGAGPQACVRALLPGARAVTLLSEDGKEHILKEIAAGLYAGPAPQEDRPYRLRIQWPDAVQETEDAYGFGLQLQESDLQALAAGDWQAVGRCLGARCVSEQGVPGVRFAVWAPNARRVAVVGDFNGWDGRRHGMRLRHAAGVWEIFVPRAHAGQYYKYLVHGADGSLVQKADPVAWQSEAAPGTASIVAEAPAHDWTDHEWMASRAARQGPDAPISIYEVHAGSWMAAAGSASLWHQLAEKLPAYARALGFTHVELLPVMEHPFGGSWGYQPLGLFSPSGRWGTPQEFAHFVDRCHAHGLGVILDWVPAHFPNDAHGLARFDGTALYEYADPREGYHPDWNTCIYNLGRNEVKAMVIASALHWLQAYHVDGLRVDAVASMLYRDYSRNAGEWIPNHLGGRENFESVAFLREMNSAVHAHCPGAITVAEESTAWPGVTAPPHEGGLGFDYKWNMGWMHDTLRYMRHDPVHRSHHHDDMTFGMVYAYSERFILPLSHDEVVHGKGSLLGKMPGWPGDRLANLRAYYGFMWGHPGRKLLFMGGEMAQPGEWNHDAVLPWQCLDDAGHRGVQRLVADLNALYAELPELHAWDARPEGFSWVIGDDRRNSVLAWLRTDGQALLLGVSNFTPVARHGYRVGVPRAGLWRERLNTDAAHYGGGNRGNGGQAHTQDAPAHGQAQSLTLLLPPLSTLFLRYEG